MDRVGYAAIALYAAARKYPRVLSFHALYVGFESDIARAYLGSIPPESMSAHNYPGRVLTGNYLEKCIPGLARKREDDGPNSSRQIAGIKFEALSFRLPTRYEISAPWHSIKLIC